MTYSISYKISEPDASRFGVEEHSDSLGVSYETSDKAIEAIRDIRDDPNRAGAYCDWLAFAHMWVVDEDGRIIWS